MFIKARNHLTKFGENYSGGKEAEDSHPNFIIVLGTWLHACRCCGCVLPMTYDDCFSKGSGIRGYSQNWLGIEDSVFWELSNFIGGAVEFLLHHIMRHILSASLLLVMLSAFSDVESTSFFKRQNSRIEEQITGHQRPWRGQGREGGGCGYQGSMRILAMEHSVPWHSGAGPNRHVVESHGSKHTLT